MLKINFQYRHIITRINKWILIVISGNDIVFNCFFYSKKNQYISNQTKSKDITRIIHIHYNTSWFWWYSSFCWTMSTVITGWLGDILKPYGVGSIRICEQCFICTFITFFIDIVPIDFIPNTSILNEKRWRWSSEHG